MKYKLPHTQSTAHRIIALLTGCVLCFAFYAALCYLIPRTYAPLKIIDAESAPRFGRFLLALFAILYGCFACHEAESVYLAQIPNLLLCFGMRLYCHYQPLIKEETEGAVSTVVTPEWNPAPTVPEWIQIVLYTLIPVGLSLAVALACRRYRRETHAAGKDRILLDPPPRK